MPGNREDDTYRNNVFSLYDLYGHSLQKVKSQRHTKVKNVYNMMSLGDTTICQNLVCLCPRAKTSCQTQIHGENIILILRSKVKVIQSS